MSDLLEEASRYFEKETADAARSEASLGLVLKPLLWEVISDQIPVQEKDEIKSILGMKLIQDNEDMKREIEALLEIVSVLQADNDGKERKLSQITSLSLTNSAERQLVEQEIQMLVQNIKYQGEDNGTNGTEYLEKKMSVAATPREQTLLTYVTTGARPSSATTRPKTARPKSRPGTSKSLPAATREAEVADVQPYLSVFKVDGVLNRVREMLQEEQNDFKADIEYLQNCMEDETTFGAQVENDPSSVLQGDIPSTKELREYSSKLKATWLQEEQENDHRLMMQKGPNTLLSRPRTPTHPQEVPRSTTTKAKKSPTSSKTRKSRSKEGHRKKGNGRARAPTPPDSDAPTNVRTVNASVFNFTGVGVDSGAPKHPHPKRTPKKTHKTKTKTPRSSTSKRPGSRVRNRLQDAQDLAKQLN